MKVGDYVRFKNGEIEKIHSFAEKDNPLFNILINARYHNTNEIKKHGELIDLIEVGDYVNGSRVVDISEQCVWVEEMEYDAYTDRTACSRYNNEDIKSIVTREMFESMEYKVGE
jgi:hypothetical protein